MLYSIKRLGLGSPLEYLKDNYVGENLAPYVQENLDLPTLATDISPYLPSSVAISQCFIIKSANQTSTSASGSNGNSGIGFGTVSDYGTGITIAPILGGSPAAADCGSAAITLPAGALYHIIGGVTFDGSAAGANLVVQMLLLNPASGGAYWTTPSVPYSITPYSFRMRTYTSTGDLAGNCMISGIADTRNGGITFGLYTVNVSNITHISGNTGLLNDGATYLNIIKFEQ